MRVGVHCSVRNGFTAALQEAVSLGCEAFQMFTQSPRGWRTRVYDDREFADFRRRREKSGLHPIAVHSPYLPNLCTSDPRLYGSSLKSLKDDLRRCEKLGADYLVIHAGAYSPGSDYGQGLKNITGALNEALKEVPGRSKVLIENVAGGGRRIGGRFRELRDILENVEAGDRMGVCFDTCHALGAGYDLSRQKGIDDAISEFDREVGLSRILLFHVNDSKAPLNSHRDLHEHIGQGHIGEEGFRLFFKTPAFRRCAFILETPKEPRPQADIENLRRLRACLPAA